MGKPSAYSVFHTIYYSDVPGVHEIIGGAYNDINEAYANAGDGCHRIDEDVICSHTRELKGTIQHHIENLKKAA